MWDLLYQMYLRFILLKSELMSIRNVRKLLNTYYDIRQKYYHEHNADVVIVTPDKMGDLLYLLSFLNGFIRENEGKKVLVLGNISKELFFTNYRIPQNNTILIEDADEWEKLQSLLENRFIFRKAWKENFIFSSPLSLVSFLYVKPWTYIGLQKKILRLKKSTKPAFPIVQHSYIKSIDNFDQICDRIIVINQYSNSSRVPEECFDYLSTILTNKGYIVYSNVVGAQKAAKCARPLNCSFEELHEICSRSLLVISARSGVVDFVLSDVKRMAVIYSSKYWHLAGARRWAKIFNVHEWESDCDVLEIISNDREEIFNKIVQHYDL